MGDSECFFKKIEDLSVGRHPSSKFKSLESITGLFFIAVSKQIGKYASRLRTRGVFPIVLSELPFYSHRIS